MKNDPDYQPHSRTPLFQEHIYAAVFRHENQAIRLVEHLIQNDFLMDRISLLGKRFSKGDDILGIYYPSPQQRLKTWTKNGILWGGSWGLFAGLIGIFMTPDPRTELTTEFIIKGSIAAIIYGVLVGGSVAIAAALTNLANELHRMGIPKDQLKILEQAIKDDKHVIVMQGSREELERFRFRTENSGAEFFVEFANDQFEQ